MLCLYNKGLWCEALTLDDSGRFPLFLSISFQANLVANLQSTRWSGRVPPVVRFLIGAFGFGIIVLYSGHAGFRFCFGVGAVVWSLLPIRSLVGLSRVGSFVVSPCRSLVRAVNSSV